MDTTTSKTRTITLTGRPPIKIRDDDWPQVAVGTYSDYDGQFEFQSFRTWNGYLRVRQHADGRTLVYGCDDHDTAYQSEIGWTYRDGELLEAPADTQATVAAIMRVAEEIVARGGNERMLEVARECVADLPAEEL